MTGERESIVTALGKVDTLAPSPWPPSVIQPFAAWPVWASSEPRSRCVWDEAWYAFVAVPAGAAGSTIEAGDELRYVVADALALVAKVDRIEAWSWPIDQTQAAVPVVRYSLTMPGGM